MTIDELAKELHESTRKTTPCGKFFEWDDLPDYKKDKKKTEASFLLGRNYITPLNHVFRKGHE